MKKLVVLFIGILFSLNVISQEQTVGLFYNENASFNGYSLFAPFKTTTTYLIDNCGRLVNSWESDYIPGASVYLKEDGHLIRTCLVETPEFANFAGLGGRIEEYDWDGNLVWYYEYHGSNYQSHHDIAPMPNGNILMLVWDSYSPAEALQSGRDPEILVDALWSEKIVEIQPLPNNQAAIVWEWKLWDHLVQDFDSEKDNFGSVVDHPELMNLNYSATEGTNALKDWIHANAIDYNEELDQIILSSRNLSEFIIIDHSTTTAEAVGHSGGFHNKGGDLIYRYGNPESYDRGTVEDRQLSYQHNPHWIPKGLMGEGKIMVFNNQYKPDTSAVIILSPPVDLAGHYKTPGVSGYGPEEFDWIFASSEIYSSAVSGAQRLPNGNILICSGIPGKFLEVTADMDPLWRYVNPVGLNGPVNQGEIPTANVAFRIERFAPDFPGFDGIDLIPGDPIELNPYPSECFVSLDSLAKMDIKVYLEGPFEENKMKSNLNGQELISLNQPYNESPWFYHGTECVDALPNANIVDWVLVEIRDAISADQAFPGDIVSRQAAFLLEDGSIVGLDGESKIEFYNSFTENLFIVIWHRNHLAIMSSQPFIVVSDAWQYDFTTSSSQVFGNSQGYKEIITGVWAMVGGNGFHDGEINESDKIYIWNPEAGMNGYLMGDYNMDGIVDNKDKNDLLLFNLGKVSQVP